ncbi:hypothetical protein BDW22DRAFT_717725 [Trametopsis cervina]|nr:hypothetical protein BDW22DRAFT_717725 [Trametopsis cervina]
MPSTSLCQPPDSRRTRLDILASVRPSATRRPIQRILTSPTNSPSQLHIVDVLDVMGNCSTRAGFLLPLSPTFIWTIASTADRVVLCVSYEHTSVRCLSHFTGRYALEEHASAAADISTSSRMNNCQPPASLSRPPQHSLLPPISAPSQLHIVDVLDVMGNCSIRDSFLPISPYFTRAVTRTAVPVMRCVSSSGQRERDIFICSIFSIFSVLSSHVSPHPFSRLAYSVFAYLLPLSRISLRSSVSCICILTSRVLYNTIYPLMYERTIERPTLESTPHTSSMNAHR